MVTRLLEDVWWVDLQGVNAYLVEDGDGTTLVDTGMPWQSGRLRRAIEAVAGSVSQLDRVVLTHFDFDHVGGLDGIGTDTPVYVGVNDEPFLAGRERPGWTSPKAALQRVTGLFRSAPDQPIETLADGDTVGEFTAYHTPGHTPGHTAFVHEELSAAFLGDLVRESDGRFERPPRALNHDHDLAGESITGFLDRAPAFETACQGHGTPFVTEGDEHLAECASRLEAGATPPE